MNLESGKIYDAEVFEEVIVDGNREYVTQSLFLKFKEKSPCGGCYEEGSKCNGLVRLIFPRAIGSEKKADVDNPLQMVEALICLNYEDRILRLRKGKLSIYLGDAFEFSSNWIAESDYQKKLLTEFRCAQEKKK